MHGNPLKEFLDDELYRLLWEKGFLNERAIRDYYIRKKFEALKSRKKPKEIIQKLQEEFSYLSTETIRKIVYTKFNDPQPWNY
ncbi:MAG: hypothetical protein D6748_08965 [Calditrichaeota bacterium]|nr:MAG: hypothetical protein D6748_08965 [Calditrichota bacterium]